MAKIALVRPPSIVSAGSFSGFLTPPIGLAYIGGSLRNEGHKVTIIARDREDWGFQFMLDLHLDYTSVSNGLHFQT